MAFSFFKESDHSSDVTDEFSEDSIEDEALNLTDKELIHKSIKIFKVDAQAYLSDKQVDSATLSLRCVSKSSDKKLDDTKCPILSERK